jgi:rhomboid protease GluP
MSSKPPPTSPAVPNAVAQHVHPPNAWIEISRTPDRRVHRNHALVLQSLDIPHGAFESSGLLHVIVQAPFAARASEELQRYERENVGWPPRELAPRAINQGIHAAILYGGLLILFFVLQVNDRFDVDWLAAGRSDAARVQAGEWWRAFTALTLHGDVVHLAGNVVFGAAFGIIAAQSLGVVVAWWSFVIAGGVGNWLNALAQDSSHRSIGASTAVFGALGLQVAYEWMRRGELRYRGWRRWAPVVMGVGLLAWLGTGGVSVDTNPKEIDSALERVDIAAHGFGFAVGALLGLLLGYLKRLPRLSPPMQIVCTLLAPAFLAWTWYLALRAH